MLSGRDSLMAEGREMGELLIIERETAGGSVLLLDTGCMVKEGGTLLESPNYA
jgi:hypothetical protein